MEVGPGSVRADPQHLRQILANLLGNATKFTQDGTITVSMEAKDERISLHITDTGLGMSAETLGFIFTAYARASFSDAKAFEGTGLGLPIAHELAEQMSGTLTVTSVLGSGSTFSLSLPATPS